MVGKLYVIGSFVLELISISREDYGSMIKKSINSNLKQGVTLEARLPPSCDRIYFKTHIYRRRLIDCHSLLQPQ